jgi:pyruvate-formate lyase
MKTLKINTSAKFQTELRITETYKRYKDAHPAIREAMCLKEQYPDFFTPIREDDLFAGRIKNTLVGITPDEWGSTAFGYYCVSEKIMKELEDKSIDDDLRTKVLEMVKFWKKESTSSKLRNSYSDLMKKYLPSDNWMGEPGIAFPLYRLTGGNVNWDKLLKKGIPGLIRDTEEYINDPDTINKEYYEATKIALEVLIDICNFYSEQARELAIHSKDDARKAELEKIASTLEVITVSAPKNLREAIQLFWLYSYAGDIRNYGRMDVYLGDFYVNDISTGSLNDEEALKLLQSLWRLIGARNTVVHSRVIIGGKGRPNEDNADRFALLAMEASRTVFEIEPQLSLRFYNGQNPELMEKALQVIGEGRTYPILYNDDVNIETVKSAFGFDENTALQYVPYGCGEYIIDHQSFGTPSGVVNLLKALEVTLHNGIDPFTGKQAGIARIKREEMKTFEDLWNAYTQQVEHFVDIMADQEVLEYKIAGEHAPYLYMSLLYDDCFEKGEGMFSGGIRYLGGTLETYGNTNTADSLTAIKKLVYEEKLYSLAEVIKALDSNFEGYDRMRQQLRNAPKYGNDIEEADNMLVRVHEHVCHYVKKQSERTGLHSYLVVIINNSANTLMGHWTSASADGRLYSQPMANGNNPSGGNDRNGPTAFLNSLLKPSPYIHAGAVQNMKFSRDMFQSKIDILKSLLTTYFENGGAQAMITVTDRNELEKAMLEPDKYSHIFVRVGGFSARFVELSRDVQLEIMSRTLY